MDIICLILQLCNNHCNSKILGGGQIWDIFAPGGWGGGGSLNQLGNVAPRDEDKLAGNKLPPTTEKVELRGMAYINNILRTKKSYPSWGVISGECFKKYYIGK